MGYAHTSPKRKRGKSIFYSHRRKKIESATFHAFLSSRPHLLSFPVAFLPPPRRLHTMSLSRDPAPPKPGIRVFVAAMGTTSQRLGNRGQRRIPSRYLPRAAVSILAATALAAYGYLLTCLRSHPSMGANRLRSGVLWRLRRLNNLGYGPSIASVAGGRTDLVHLGNLSCLHDSVGDRRTAIPPHHVR
jgi:hypothetical protein